MKIIKNTFFIAICLSALSCKKFYDDKDRFKASLFVINAVASPGNNVKILMGTNSNKYYIPLEVNYSAWDGFNSNGLKVFGLPTNEEYRVEAVMSRDTLNPIFQHRISAMEGEGYSLYLMGTTEKVESLLLKDLLPRLSDQQTGIRFINLSPDTDAIMVNLAGSEPGSEQGTLAYKEAGLFKLYPAKPSTASYVFEIRNSADGELLSKFNFSRITAGRCVTIAFRGLRNGFPSAEAVQINHY